MSNFGHGHRYEELRDPGSLRDPELDELLKPIFELQTTTRIEDAKANLLEALMLIPLEEWADAQTNLAVALCSSDKGNKSDD